MAKKPKKARGKGAIKPDAREGVDKHLPDQHGGSPSKIGRVAMEQSEGCSGDENHRPVDASTKGVGIHVEARSIPTMARIFSVVMLMLVIVAVGVLFYRVMAGFFVPLFLSVLLVVLFRPVHNWILARVGARTRLACLATTALILFIVLMPVFTVVSIAAGQFTSMISHVDFEDLTGAMHRAREQVGVSLKHPEQFRRLDHLAEQLGDLEDRNVSLDRELVVRQVREALMLLEYLQVDEEGEASADLAASNAALRLNELLEAVQTQSSDGVLGNDLVSEDRFIDDGDTELIGADSSLVDRSRQVAVANEDPGNPPNAGAVTNDGATQTHSDLIDRIRGEEAFHRKSVIASASIRAWVREFLGGTFWSQARLFANPSAEDFKSLLTKLRQSIQPRFVTFTSATGSFLVEATLGIMVLVIAVYFFLHDGASMIRTLMRLSPLDDRYEERLLLEFERTSRAVVLASVASAVVQGLLSAIAFYFLGFNSVIFLFLVATMMSLVPFLGAASVWVPCAAYLGAVEQRWGAAIFLFIYGATLVSSIDNVIKVYVLHGRSTMHPLFALLSVLGGVKVFGPIGILVGPMVVVFLQTLLEILNHELEERDLLRKKAKENDVPESESENKENKARLQTSQ